MARPRLYKKRDYNLYRRSYNIYRACKQRSETKGLPFSLTVDWIKNKYEIGKCDVTGLSFEFNKKRGMLSPSVDRIIPELGYTPENCRMVLWWFNIAKHKLDDLSLWYFCNLVTNSYTVNNALDARRKAEIGARIISPSMKTDTSTVTPAIITSTQTH